MLHDGLYEQIISKAMEKELAATDKRNEVAAINSEEAPKILAKYIAEIIEHKLSTLKDNKNSIDDQVALVNRVISTVLSEVSETDFDEFSIAERAEQLLALFDTTNSIWAFGDHSRVVRPETSVSQSSLFTGAVHEPQMYSELKKEIVLPISIFPFLYLKYNLQVLLHLLY